MYRVANLCVPTKGKGTCRTNKTRYFGAGIILCQTGEFGEVDGWIEKVVLAHVNGVDVKNLDATVLVRETDLDVNF